MPDRQDSDRDTFTRIMVAIAVNDAEPPPSRLEIDHIGDELIEWGHRLRDEFRRAAIAERVAKLSRAEIEARLAARIAPTDCCTRLSSYAGDPLPLTDEDLRKQLVESDAFIEPAAA